MKPKLADASDLTAPLPNWRWLVWYRPSFASPPLGELPKYLVFGTDDRAEAEARASGSGYSVTENPRFQEWRDHIPSGYEDQSGYGQVSCSCGWDSGDKLGWEAHIDAAASAVTTPVTVTPPSETKPAG